ncbi:MAG: hypothetical protein ACI810_000235 [Gammaproteobacteria bacterium]|jgi:hypothetical protein
MSTKIAPLIANGKVAVTKLETDALGAKAYNALLLSADFWETVRGRNKMLVFQTDSLCCSQTDYPLSHFFDFEITLVQVGIGNE